MFVAIKTYDFASPGFFSVKLLQVDLLTTLRLSCTAVLFRPQTLAVWQLFLNVYHKGESSSAYRFLYSKCVRAYSVWIHAYKMWMTLWCKVAKYCVDRLNLIVLQGFCHSSFKYSLTTVSKILLPNLCSATQKLESKAARSENVQFTVDQLDETRNIELK